MAVNVTHLTSGGVDGPGTNSHSTASISPSADATLLIGVTSRLSGNDFDEIADPSGGGLTWTSIHGVNHDSGGTGSYLEIWRAETGSSPGSFSIDLDSTDNPSGCLWQVLEVAGTDLTSDNGFEQYAVNDASSGISITSTFGTAPASDSAVLQFCSLQSSVDKTMVAESGFSIADETAPVDNEQTAVQYIEASSPSAIESDWQGGTSGGIGVIAVEFNAGSTAQDITPGLVQSLVTVFAPTVTTTVDVTPGLVQSLVTVFAPTVTAAPADSPILIHFASMIGA